MDDEEYDAAVSHLFAYLERLGRPDMTNAAFEAGTTAESGRSQLIASLRALRDEVAASDNFVGGQALTRLNSVARTESGERISGLYVEVSEPGRRALGGDQINLTEGGDSQREAVRGLDDLLRDVEADSQWP